MIFILHGQFQFVDMSQCGSILKSTPVILYSYRSIGYGGRRGNNRRYLCVNINDSRKYKQKNVVKFFHQYQSWVVKQQFKELNRNINNLYQDKSNCFFQNIEINLKNVYSKKIIWNKNCYILVELANNAYFCTTILYANKY